MPRLVVPLLLKLLGNYQFPIYINQFLSFCVICTHQKTEKKFLMHVHVCKLETFFQILQHLIKGYIPEKPAKCPDWFYQEITRPCLLHQKIDRPSMKTVIQILQTR